VAAASIIIEAAGEQCLFRGLVCAYAAMFQLLSDRTRVAITVQLQDIVRIAYAY